MRRRTPVRRLCAAVVLGLALLAQPQLMCGLHCLMMGHAMSATVPSGHQNPGHEAPGGSPMHMGLCHGSSVTGHPVARTGRLAVAWIPATAARLRVASSVSRTPQAASQPPTSPAFLPESPPPRG